MLTQGALQVTQIGVRANLSSVVLFMVDSILITFFGGCMRIAVLV
ncbi:putative membrane protein [Mycobacteroides abscessus 21]|uniref:Putative membrane protein n=1 Tax=Mycobacteroides abscessus 21 TaxID=1299324 RepID=A0A829Q5W7_9MYCO|nr:putative membrane protein [Mycobacteroides abscessus 21]